MLTFSDGPHLPLCSLLRLDCDVSLQPSAYEISTATCCLGTVVHPTGVCIFYILCMLTDLASLCCHYLLEEGCIWELSSFIDWSCT